MMQSLFLFILEIEWGIDLQIYLSIFLFLENIQGHNWGLALLFHLKTNGNSKFVNLKWFWESIVNMKDLGW